MSPGKPRLSENWVVGGVRFSQVSIKCGSSSRWTRGTGKEILDHSSSSQLDVDFQVLSGRVILATSSCTRV